MRAIVFILMLMVGFAYAEESCELKDIGLNRGSPLIEKYYYLGTCQFRNEEYAKAAQNWTEVAEQTEVKPGFVELQLNAFNNLGYLMFFGYGVDKNQEEAIEYWTKAIALGHEEAEYHLCHAYGDEKQSTYDPKKAIPHCEKARFLYQGDQSIDQTNDFILNQIKGYLAELKAVN
ncbi:sel1 repeat family protein [Microbulbifer sp. TYP-18]|uniref:sel1 repeat family protein n=1 Tax=Microbulbifer sp. TYP-18 TaxID=3230024 RepID=UPI0034C6D470